MNMYTNFKRFSCTGILLLSAAVQAVANSPLQSELVYPGTDGKLVYTLHANTGEQQKVNVIPDFSTAGYMGGGVRVPVGEVPVKKTVQPEGPGKDRKNIQDAIDYVSSLPVDENGFRGAVLLKAGEYDVTDKTIKKGKNCFKITASGVVIRGEGQGPDGTVIKSLTPKKHTAFQFTVPSGEWKESETNKVQITSDYVGTGAKTFTVDDASEYSVGDDIWVIFEPKDRWFDEVGANHLLKENFWQRGYFDTNKSKKTQKNSTVYFERKISGISGNQITIESSIVQPMQKKYCNAFMAKRGEETRLSQCGVEDLRIIGIPVYETGDLLKNGVDFKYVVNSWVHGVTLLRASYATVHLNNSHHITVEECSYKDGAGKIRGGYRYSFCIEYKSSHNFFQRNYSSEGRHDYVTQARVPGPNVFLDSLSVNGHAALGPHHRWSMGNLFDNIKSETHLALAEHRGGGGSGHSWAAVTTIGWNCESPTLVCDTPIGHQNYTIGCIGEEKKGVVPHTKDEKIHRGYWEHQNHHVGLRSLYIQQLADRLGPEAVNNVILPVQQAGTIYHILDKWAGDGDFLDYINESADLEVK